MSVSCCLFDISFTQRSSYRGLNLRWRNDDECVVALFSRESRYNTWVGYYSRYHFPLKVETETETDRHGEKKGIT